MATSPEPEPWPNQTRKTKAQSSVLLNQKRCADRNVEYTELLLSSLFRARATSSCRIGPRSILDHHSGKNITGIITVISGTAKMA